MKISQINGLYSVSYPSKTGNRNEPFRTILKALDFSVLVIEWITDMHQEVRDYLETHDHVIKEKGGMKEFIRIVKRPSRRLPRHL